MIAQQLEWIEERDATCKRETKQNRGGNGYSAFLNNCLMRITIERTKLLREYLR
ncbi:lysozyme inhibitor LprI family protein [Pseudanabaena sp. BC1403]|uniref:lysozyme inhibitor LprI family protein n=1 Tax=Pseudanabaena sp. BC1403 TaxID=2043171 RepID=UPI000CD8BC8B